MPIGAMQIDQIYEPCRDFLSSFAPLGNTNTVDLRCLLSMRLDRNAI